MTLLLIHCPWRREGQPWPVATIYTEIIYYYTILPQIMKARPTLLLYKQSARLQSVQAVKKLWSPWELLCCYHGLIETAGYTIFLNRRHPYRITFICVETNIYQAAPRNNKHFIYSVMPLSPYDQPGGYMLLPQIYKWEKITLGSWVTC